MLRSSSARGYFLRFLRDATPGPSASMIQNPDSDPQLPCSCSAQVVKMTITEGKSVQRGAEQRGRPGAGLALQGP